MSFNAEDAARLLIEARRGGKLLADLPAPLQPASVEQAYAIQDAVCRSYGPVGGWKVGPWRAPAIPTCSPIPACHVHDSPALLSDDDMPEARAEVEIAVRLACDLPTRDLPYDAGEMRATMGSVHLAAEIVTSRFRDRQEVSPLTAIADTQNNGAVVVGPGRSDWAGLELGTVAMRLERDGTEIATADGGSTTEEVLTALAWLANHAASRSGGLLAGQVVITGARISPQPVAGSTVQALAQGLEPVSFSFGAKATS